nr:winged helix-turn-helix domain-containing protein [uncultured Pseudoxanthomonas sp.]
MTTLKSTTYPDAVRVGDWQAIRATGELVGAQGASRLEPKVADLLFLLASRRGAAVTREEIMDALWPGQVVGDDSLARAVFKLRQALGDDAKSPRYIETLSKRGYRLIAEPTSAASPEDVAAPDAVSAPALRTSAVRRRWMWGALAVVIGALVIGGAWWSSGWRSNDPAFNEGGSGGLIAQADDFYFQFSRGDNESAIELYERVLGLEPDNVPALAGLANALVQRSVRWPALPGEQGVQFRRLGDALAHGHLARPPASQQLERARLLAARAVALDPESAAAHKATGFVASAQGRFNAALAAYQRAVQLDVDAWGSLINIGDVLEISGRKQEALPYFERAYDAMERSYAKNRAQIRPWHAQLGALIAQRYLDRGEPSLAEAWFRRVLAHSPLHPESTRGLARLLRAGGDDAQADRLCAELASRVGASESCQAGSPAKGDVEG